MNSKRTAMPFSLPVFFITLSLLLYSLWGLITGLPALILSEYIVAKNVKLLSRRIYHAQVAVPFRALSSAAGTMP
jgi:hypothetical protein